VTKTKFEVANNNAPTPEKRRSYNAIIFPLVLFMKLLMLGKNWKKHLRAPKVPRAKLILSKRSSLASRCMKMKVCRKCSIGCKSL